MKSDEILIVCPKKSSYSLKSFSEQHVIEEKVHKIVELANTTGKRICCFAQDFLAIELMKPYSDITWLNALSVADKAYLKVNKEEFEVPEDYFNLQMQDVKSRCIQNALDKITLQKRGITSGRGVELDEDAQKIRRGILRDRLRLVCDDVINNEAKIVYYLDAKNNFCSRPKFEMPCCPTLIVDTLADGSFYMYGGVPVDKSIMERILGGEL